MADWFKSHWPRFCFKILGSRVDARPRLLNICNPLESSSGAKVTTLSRSNKKRN